MATAKEGNNRSADIIKNWLRNRYTIEFLGTWEIIHNPNFKVVEFDHFIRDYATINEQGMSQSERLVKLNQIDIHQMKVLKSGDNDRKLLK